MDTTNKNVRKRRRRRNEYRMKMDLLEAVRIILKSKGYINLDIQSVCGEADVDRNSIYRHFKDFDNLLTEFLESTNYWTDSFKIEIDDSSKDYKMLLKSILLNQYDVINKNPELQQALVWELAEQSLRTKFMAKRRENQYEEFVERNEKEFAESEIDINGSFAVIMAGIIYLIVHKKHSTFLNVDLGKEKERIPKVIDELVEMLFDAKEKNEQKLMFAKKALKKGVDIETVCDIFELPSGVVENLA